jgi:hypothetical protein
MDVTEFNGLVKPTFDTIYETWDIRVFGERQDEALVCFLNDIEARIKNRTFSTTGLPICILHDRRLAQPADSLKLMSHVRGLGVPLNFKEEELQKLAAK